MNVAQCRFRPAELQCRDDKSDSCLSGAQVEAIERAFAGPTDAAGYPIYVRVPYDTNGAAFTEASRYYMNPGMGHCGGGNAYDRFDLLGPLVDWVEQGKPPANLVASRADGSASMPLCPHPSYPHYRAGDPAKAESYECRTPSE